MEENKFAILGEQYRQIKHPKTGRPIKVYRIISLKSFHNPMYGEVPAQTIGGFVQYEENLDQRGNAWVAHQAMVFGSAEVSGDSVVMEDAVVYGNAKITGYSVIKNRARVFENADVQSSQVSDKAIVFGKTTVKESYVFNASKVGGNASIGNSNLRVGAFVHGDAVLLKTTVTDQSEVRGSANLYNCQLSGRTVIIDQTMENETIDSPVNLSVHKGRAGDYL